MRPVVGVVGPMMGEFGGLGLVDELQSPTAGEHVAQHEDEYTHEPEAKGIDASNTDALIRSLIHFFSIFYIFHGPGLTAV